MGSATPYRVIAPFYNAIMAHVDYPVWAGHIRTLWRAYKGQTPPGRVLELAAGTCPFAAPPLFPAAFSVHTDLSRDMLRQAADNPALAKAGLPPPRRAACDVRAIPFKGSFDLVFMMYDSLNYLIDPEEVVGALAGVKRLLSPGGLFILDVTTTTCSRRHFADTLDFQELEGGTALRASRYDGKTRLQLNHFTFFLAGPDGRYDRREEVHQQRVYPAAALTRMAQKAGFEVKACLADFTLEPGSDQDERLHFVLGAT